jgi:molecular chaperone HtpG
LTQLISIHDMAIKSLAVHDDDCFRVFGPLLPVETSSGRMTLRELRRHDAKIRYAPTVDDFRQVARVAAAQRLCVVNAGYSYVEDLLAKLAESDSDVTLEIVDASTLAAGFNEPSDAESLTFTRLLEVAAMTLGSFNVGVELRTFEPDTIPVLFTNDIESLIYRETKRNREIGETALGGVLEDLFSGDRKPPQCRLIFNAANPLVRQVAAVDDRKLVRSIVGTLFTQALLLGQHPLTAQELGLLNGSLGELIAAAVRGISAKNA